MILVFKKLGELMDNARRFNVPNRVAVPAIILTCLVICGLRFVAVKQLEAKNSPFSWADQVQPGQAAFLDSYQEELHINGSKGSMQVCFQCRAPLPSTAKPTKKVWVKTEDEMALRNHQARGVLLCLDCEGLQVSKLTKVVNAWRVLEMMPHKEDNPEEFELLKGARLSLVDTSVPGSYPSFRSYWNATRKERHSFQLSRR